MNIVLAMAQGLVVMLVAPFFSGLARVIRAKMHNRRGPSILQDYRDLAKLMARPESVSSDSSFVLRPVTVDGKTVGAIGVIGPKRMDYKKVLASLDYFATGLSEELDGHDRSNTET